MMLNQRKYETMYVFGILIGSKDKKEVMCRIKRSCKKKTLIKIGDIIVVHGIRNIEFFKITKIEDFYNIPGNIPIEEVLIKYV